MLDALCKECLERLREPESELCNYCAQTPIEKKLSDARMRIRELQSNQADLLKMLFSKKQTTGIEAELSERLKGLLSLVHPDRHGGNELSHKVTIWLLSVKDRLKDQEAEHDRTP